MKWAQWLENWDMTSLRITTPFLEMNWEPKDADKDAAWELYIELLTRITTQSLDDGHGDEKTALASIHSLFGITRSIIRNYKRDCSQFTKIAIVVLNQKVRPFTAKWHKSCIEGALDRPDECAAFRAELKQLQGELCKYAKMLADMAGVEDLTSLEG